MKSIKCLSLDNYGISALYVILTYFISTILSVPSCGLYGASPCQFLPAPQGQTPSCARPGKTYCEHVDNYPTYLIKHLVHKWGYEANKLIVDETWEDFTSTIWTETPVFYDPAYIFPQKQYNNNRHNNYGFSGYDYESPTIQTSKHYVSSETPNYLLYSTTATQKNQQPCLDRLKVTPNNPVYHLKRIARDLSSKSNAANSKVKFLQKQNDLNKQKVAKTVESQDVSINLGLLGVVGKTRTKRQSPGRNILCQTFTQFVTPQAALNSKGNWMFIVNEANTARQQVKAELCASNTCSNLCQLPNGYNSRCEQKFVQKRLIALQSNGQNLYTDTFWFPSCCVCTIAAN